MTPIPSHAGDSKGAFAAALRPASTGLHRRKQERLLPCQQDRGGVAPVLPAPCRTGLARLWRSIAIHGEAATYAQRHSRPSCVEIKLQAEMAEGRKAAVKAAELQLWVGSTSSPIETAVVRALSAGLSRRVATSAAHPLAVREKARSTRGRWLLRDSYRALRPRRPQTATPAWPPFVVRLRGTAVGRTLPTKPNAPMASKSASGPASGMARKASCLRPGFRWPSVFRVHDGRCRLRSKPGSGALGPR
jgi:hypothetical protein